MGAMAESRSARDRRRAADDARHSPHRRASSSQARPPRDAASPPLRCSIRAGSAGVPAIDGPARGRHPRSTDDTSPLPGGGRRDRAEHRGRAVEMSRLYEALAAIEGKAHVLPRTDLPRFHAERRARHRSSVIALGAVAVLGAVGLCVMLSAPATPSPSAPAVPPLPSLQHPEPLRAPELRERAREATVLGSLARAEALLERALALDPANAAAWNDLGVVLVRRRQHRRGIEAIQRSLALDPKHADAHRKSVV